MFWRVKVDIQPSNISSNNTPNGCQLNGGFEEGISCEIPTDSPSENAGVAQVNVLPNLRVEARLLL